MELRIQLFGGFSVWRDGVLVTEWGSEQAKTLLKILLTKPGQVLLNDQLIESLWPDADPERSLQSLRARVHALRQVLEPNAKSEYQFIETLSGGYRFNSRTGCTADVWEFSELAEKAREFQEQRNFQSALELYGKALALYQGGYLPEDRYEEWAFHDWQRWREIYISTLLEAADCHAQLGRYRLALDQCMEAVKTSPLREDLYRQAMIYCYLMGNSNEAISIYQECEAAIQQEMGHPPDPQTRRLVRQITDGHVPDVDPEYRPPVLIRHPLHHSLSRLPFTGRTQEWTLLVNLLEEVLGAQSRTALIGGEAGVGKTRLAQEILQMARREHGFNVLQARCGELSGRAPFEAVLSALKNQLDLLSPDQLQDLPRRSVAVLRPWLADLPDDHLSNEVDLELPALAPELERLRLFEAVAQLLIWLSQRQRPTLLWLDDLQWADSLLIDWLDYAISRLTDQPILLLATYRDEDLANAQPLQRLIRHVEQAARTAQAQHIRLSRLTQAEVADLVHNAAAEIKDENWLAQHLFQESGGNPLFMVFLLQSLFEDRLIEIGGDGSWVPRRPPQGERFERQLPREIERVIQDRMSRLDPVHRSLLESLSVMGANASPELWLHCWQTTSPTSSQGGRGFAAALERLEKMQIIYFDPSGYNFVHDKIREVFYRQIEADRRRSLHAGLAGLLSQSSRPDGAPFHELLAYHYGQAGLLQQALSHILPALKEAQAQYRNHEGLALATRALEYLPLIMRQPEEAKGSDEIRFQILTERVKLLEILAKRDEQACDIDMLLALAQSLDCPEKLAQAHLLKAKLLIDTTRYPEAQLESYRALELAKRLADPALEARALHSIGLVCWYTGDYESAESYFLEEYKLQIEMGDEKGLAETLHYLSGVSWRCGRFQDWERQVGEALALREKLNDMAGKALTLLAKGVMYWSSENYPEAMKTFAEVRELAARIGDRRGEARALGNLGLVARVMGQYETAIDHLEIAARIHQEIGDRRASANDLNNLGIVYWFLGENKRAQEHCNRALTAFNEVGSQQGVALSLGNLSLVYWRQGQLQQALNMAMDSIQIHRQSNEQRNLGVGLRNLGEILHGAGESQQALEHYEQALVISKALKQKSEEMLLAMDQCRAHHSLGNPSEAFRCSERALELLAEFKQTPYGPWIWHCSYQALTAVNRPQDAEASLRKAYSLLIGQAGNIANERLRSSFLKQVPVHREIVQAMEQFIQTIERSDPECYELLRQSRWAGGVVCPHCGCSQTRIHGWVSDSREKRYLCTDCGRTFADRTGTVFANSNLPISKLFQGLLLIAELGKADGAKDALCERLNIHPRSARNLHRKLASALESDPLSRALVERLRQDSIQQES